MARRKDLSDFERGLIAGAQEAGALVTKTKIQLTAVSIVTEIKVTFA